MRDDDGYIGDASRSDRTDSYLGNPDTIYHGQNDEFTQKLDAQRIAALTPAERLKMGAVAGPEPMRMELRPKPKAEPESLPATPHRGALAIVIIVLVLLALLVVAKMAHGGEAAWINPSGNSQEIPVKSPIPAPSPVPTTP
jgi:hypothetical protein